MDSQPPTRARIGLLRHFPVCQPYPTGWRTSAELREWFRTYDLADTRPGPFDVGGIAWKTCLSSDLPRARFTAGIVFAGPVEATPLLREVDFARFNTGRLRLPILGWRCLWKLAWMTGHSSQRACREDLRHRISTVADRLQSADADTLVVAHAGLMMFLAAELRRRGFKGPKFHLAEHARAYVFRQPGPRTG